MMGYNNASKKSGNHQQGGPASDSENPLIQHLDRTLLRFYLNLSDITSETVAHNYIEMLGIRDDWITFKKMTESLEQQLDVATSDIQSIRSELKELKKRRELLEKELDKAATVLFSSETVIRVVDLLKYDRMISFERFQDIGCLLDEQYKHPLLALWLLRHIIQTTTHQIDRDWATCFLSLAILRGNCISYDTAESDTRENRVKNVSDPRNADKFMRNVVCQGVRDSYEYYRTKFLSEFPLDSYSKKARIYIEQHSIERED
jgi:hypothetical protein